MIKLFSKLSLIVFFLFNLSIFNLCLVDNVSASPKVSDYKLDLNIEIPGMENSSYSVGENMLGRYIQAWYNFMLGTIGILATVMVMIGGFKYLTSQGDKGQIQTAQNTIISAITGLVLAFGMHAILSLVNPNLLKLTMPKIGEIGYEGTYDGPVNPRMGGISGNPQAPADRNSNGDVVPRSGESFEDWVRREEGAPALTPKKDLCCDYPEGCPGGGCQWYLGYGRACGNTSDKNATEPPSSCASSITQERAEEWLIDDIANSRRIAEALATERGVNWSELNQTRQDVLTDMTYVMGRGGVNQFNNMWGALSATPPNYNQAANEINNSTWGRNQASNRAGRNAYLMRNGSRP